MNQGAVEIHLDRRGLFHDGEMERSTFTVDRRGLYN